MGRGCGFCESPTRLDNDVLNIRPAPFPVETVRSEAPAERREAPLAPAAVVLRARVVHKPFAFRVDRVICDVHLFPAEIAGICRVLLGGEADEAFLVDVHAQRVEGGDADVDPGAETRMRGGAPWR